MQHELLLAVIPGSDSSRQLAVVLNEKKPKAKISLRQQCWAEGIGWYDQKTLELDLDQLRQLRSVLGWNGSSRLTEAIRAQAPSSPVSAAATLPFPGARKSAAKEILDKPLKAAAAVDRVLRA